MNLTEQILHIILSMQSAFSQERSFRKFLICIFAILCMAGRHTVTSMIFFAKREMFDWTTFYRFFSRAKWDTDACFNELTKLTLQKSFLKHGKSKGEFLIAIDDFRIEKTGHTIPHTRYQLDPKSPGFHPNLMWGHRYLHAVLIICKRKRGKWRQARAITIRLELAPHLRKPGKKATEEEIKEYVKKKIDENLNVYTNNLISSLRSLLDNLGYADNNLIIVADGSYCNQEIMKNKLPRVDLIVRCRKNAKLCYEAKSGGRNFYDTTKFTPYDIYKDESIGALQANVFYGRKNVTVKYKELLNIYWQGGAGRLPLRVFAVFGVKYRKNRNGYENYRDPIYLLTTNLTIKSTKLIQYYLYRWEIEVTHRELKNDLGVCQAQVRNETSVKRCPKLVALANGICHLAYIRLAEKNESNYLSPPKWYKKRERISLEYLRRRIRQELVDTPYLQWILNIKISWRELLERVAA